MINLPSIVRRFIGNHVFLHEKDLLQEASMLAHIYRDYPDAYVARIIHNKFVDKVRAISAEQRVLSYIEMQTNPIDHTTTLSMLKDSLSPDARLFLETVLEPPQSIQIEFQRPTRKSLAKITAGYLGFSDRKLKEIKDELFESSRDGGY